jgi:HEAT repeats
VVTINHPAEGVIANVTGVVQAPNSELVQVNYNKIVPESMEGSLDSPEIRNLLLVGTRAAATPGVRMNAVSLLTDECKAGHECQSTADGNGIRHALMVSLRYDEDAGVRMKALDGLQRFVGQDQHVRDAVLEAVMHDPDAQVRQAAIGLLEPVHSDSSVRQVLRTVATQDANPYIRTASYNALQNAADIQ